MTRFRNFNSLLSALKQKTNKPRQDDSNVLLSGLVSGHFTSILRVLETEYSLNYWAERSVCLLGHVC